MARESSSGMTALRAGGTATSWTCGVSTWVPPHSLPASGQSVPVGATAAQLGAAVDEINVFLRANARQFVFQLDSSTGKSQVTVVNPQTGEIIRQIPDLHALQLAQTIADTGMPLTGMLMDTQA